ACRREYLRAVAYGRDGLAGLVELPHDLQDTVVQAQVFRRPAPGDDEPVVRIGIGLLEIVVQREIVPALFAVGLRAFEIVDGGSDAVARLFAGAHGVHGVPHRLQRLEGHHGFVVFGVIAHQHQQLLAHIRLLVAGRWPTAVATSRDAPCVYVASHMPPKAARLQVWYRSGHCAAIAAAQGSNGIPQTRLIPAPPIPAWPEAGRPAPAARCRPDSRAARRLYR